MNLINKSGIKLFYILLSLLLLGCSTSKITNKQLKSITGEIEVVGNEPFINLALKVDSAKVYILNCSSNKLKNLLMHNQGKIAKIFYSNINSKRKPYIMKVENVEIISKEFQ